MDHHILTNDDITRMTGDLVRQVTVAGEQFDFVVGIARGGVVPANMISQYFDIPMIPLQWSLRDHVRKDPAMLDDIVSLLQKEHRILFVDDLSDSGDTLAEIFSILDERVPELAPPNARSAVLIHNMGQNQFTPDFYSLEINKAEDDVWIDFPWEIWWKA